MSHTHEDCEFAARAIRLNDDTRKGLRKQLQAGLWAAVGRNDSETVRACMFALTHTRIFNRLQNYVETVAFPVFDAQCATGDVGADGDFLQWLLDWFSNGGWEEIIAFLKELLPIIIDLF